MFQISREVPIHMTIQDPGCLSCTALFSRYSEFSPFSWWKGKERAHLKHEHVFMRKNLAVIYNTSATIHCPELGLMATLILRDIDHCHLAGYQGGSRLHGYWSALTVSATVDKSFVEEIIKCY